RPRPVAEDGDEAGGDHADEAERRGEPKSHADPPHQGLLTQSGRRAVMGESMAMSSLVFIPAWNEEASVAAVIADVRKHMPEADILVVDDGSVDETAARSREAGALVASLPFNQGLGAALQTGYLYALRQGYEFCAHLDADGQHPPPEVARLLDEVISDRADLVI